MQKSGARKWVKGLELLSFLVCCFGVVMQRRFSTSRCLLCFQADLKHGILRSKWIVDAQCAVWIITPFTIDEEAVMISARREIGGRCPCPVGLLVKRNGMLQPTGEIPCQQDAVRCWSGVSEGLLFGFSGRSHKTTFKSYE